MESFTSLCISLASCYIFFTAVSVFQLGRIVEREQGVTSFDPLVWLWPITVQQQIHLIVFLLSSVRVAFFFVAMVAWDPHTGLLQSHKVEFYSLDEFATVLFFTLASVLALFWAELYYISTDKPDSFTSYLKPWTYVIIGAAFIAVAIITALASTTFASDTDFIFMDYTILVASVYFIGASLFAYYAWAVAAELRQVPIQLSARKNRLGVLRYLAAIVILALVLRAIVLICITGKSVVTQGEAAIVGVFLFYFILELFPLFVILLFYRVEGSGDVDPDVFMGPNGSSIDEEGGMGGSMGVGGGKGRFANENEALLYSSASSQFSRGSGGSGGGDTPGGGGGGGGFGGAPNSDKKSKRTISPIRTLPRYDKKLTAPTEIVNQIIARLSWGGGDAEGFSGVEDQGAPSSLASTSGASSYPTTPGKPI